MILRETGLVRSRTLRAAVAALLLGGVTSTARADDFDGPKAAAARALFDDGMKLLQAQRYAEACPKLEESNRLDPGMGVKYRLATCYEASMRLASAWVLFVQVADEAAAAKMPEREKAARARAGDLKVRLPHMVVLVSQDVAATAGLEIKADSDVLRPAVFGTSLPVDPGAHTITVSAPGHRAWKTTAQASEGATITVTIPALKEDQAAGPIASGTTTALAAGAAANGGGTNGWRGGHTADVVVAGLGLIGLGVGAAFGVDTLAKHDASKKACPLRTGCSDEAIDLENAAKRSATGSTLALIGGGAALAGGAVLFLSAGWPAGADEKKEGAGGSATVRVTASARGAMVTVEGGF